MSRLKLTTRSEDDHSIPANYGVGLSYTDDDGNRSRDAWLFSEGDSPSEAAARLRKMADWLESI